jgi:hypothetical protein
LLSGLGAVNGKEADAKLIPSEGSHIPPQCRDGGGRMASHLFYFLNNIEEARTVDVYTET